MSTFVRGMSVYFIYFISFFHGSATALRDFIEKQKILSEARRFHSSDKDFLICTCNCQLFSMSWLVDLETAKISQSRDRNNYMALPSIFILFSESVNSIQNARKRFLGALINHFSPLTIGGLQLSQENWNHFYLDGFTKHSVKWARPEKISLDLWNDTLTVCSSRNQILVSNRPKFIWKAILALSTINI